MPGLTSIEKDELTAAKRRIVQLEMELVMQAIADAGVDLDDVFNAIEDEGIQEFVDSWNELTESVRSELEGKS